MKKSLVVLLLMAVAGAHAQGFQDEPTCYSWEGGRGSAGSFSKCGPAWVTAAPAKPAVVAAPIVQAAPIQSTVCPPQIILQPEPKKPVKRKPKPPPKIC